MFLVVQEAQKTKSSPKKEKREQGSRTPNKVFYKLNCTRRITRVKENLCSGSVSDKATNQELATYPRATRVRRLLLSGRPSGSYRLVARIEMSRTAASSALQVQESLTHGSSRFTPTHGTQASYASARNRFRSRLVSVFGETESRKSGTPFLSIAMIWAYNAYRFRNQKGKSRLEFPERSMQTTELLVIGAGPYGLCIAAHASHMASASPHMQEIRA